MRRLTHFVTTHKLFVFGVWLIVAIGGMATMGSTAKRLSSNFSLPGEPGYVADAKIDKLFHNGGAQLPTVVTATAPAGSTTSPAIAYRIFDAAAHAVPGSRFADQASTGDPKFATADGRTSFALFFTAPNESLNSDPTTPRISTAAMAAAPPGWRVGVTGVGQLASGSGSRKGSSAFAATMLGSLGALAVLAFVFGSLLALLPLVVALFAIPSTFLLINGLTRLTAVSALVEFLVALIGLGVAVDYSLLIVTRWREARDNGADNRAAVEEAVTCAGHAVLFSGLTVAVSLLGVLIVPVPFLRNMAVAGAFIPLISIAVALTILPVLLDSVGPRIDRPRFRHEKNASRAWENWAGFVLQHRTSVAVAGASMLMALIVPLLSMHLGEPRTPALSQTGPARVTLTQLMAGDVPAGVLSPVEILVHADDAHHVAAEMNAIPGVYTAIAPNTPAFHAADASIVDVLPADEPSTSKGNATIARIEKVSRSISGVEGVGGAGPTQNDFIHAVYGSFPLMLTVISLVILCLLARAFRSIVLAIKAVLFNLVSVGAAYGVMVLVWQHGFGSRMLWGIPATGSLTVWVPIMVFAFLFGLSMDYEVFILSRMREEFDVSGSTEQAVIVGLGRTGRLVTSAALILFLSFVSMSTIPDTDVKVLATGLGAGILLDAVLLRSLLVPAMVGLFGGWNWWLPAWAARLLRVAASPRPPAEPQSLVLADFVRAKKGHG